MEPIGKDLSPYGRRKVGDGWRRSVTTGDPRRVADLAKTSWSGVYIYADRRGHFSVWPAVEEDTSPGVPDVPDVSVICIQLKGQARPGQARPGQARPGQARPGQARPGQARPGQARPGQARPGQARPGQARPGQARPGQARPGQARPGQARTNLKMALRPIGDQSAEIR